MHRCRTDIDAFIAEKLRANRLSSSPRLQSRALARRIYFDLVGMQPSPEQVEQFVASDGNDPFSKATDHCGATNVPIAGLLTDLQSRGLLDSTLVIWGGEFGRMPVSQNGNGRDHNPNGFLQWMAGAGIKGGVSYGETDEIGYAAVENRTSVNDLHATMLHLLGLDHRRLTYFHNGRSFRLTDVAGEVIHNILS